MANEKVSTVVVRHIIASISSLPLLVLVWAIVNPILEWLATGEFPSAGIEPLGSLFWCGCSLAWLASTGIPVSAVGEYLFIRRFAWRWWAHVPAMAGIYFFITVLVWGLLTLFLAPSANQFAVLVFGLDNMVWGVLYWSVLRLSDRVIRSRMGA